MKHTRRLALFLSVALLLCTFLSQKPVSAQVFPRQVIYAASYGMKCDGSTDDTAALRSAIAAGGLQAQIILPPGTCLISIESGDILVYDGSWISGAGTFATTIKRKNGGSANNSMFGVASGGAFGTVGNVTFTDFTIDGNQTNQTSGADNIQSLGPTSKFTAQRMRFINARRNAIFLTASSGFTADPLIADNHFESNGFSGVTPCNGSNTCGDMAIQSPLRVRVTRNHSESTRTFIITPPITGSGNVVISENVVNNCLGFAVALGGGGTNPGPAGISDNIFNCPSSIQNIVDIALWSDVRVENNTITNGTFGGIGDGPPANKVQAVGNHIIGNPANTSVCIGLGGSDIIINDNYCQGSGGPGILHTSNTAVHGVVISGNITKNNGQAVNAAGIELTTSGSLTDVIIKGNHSYDELGAGGTQSWGIGNLSGFAPTNVVIEGNDVNGNKTAGMNLAVAGITGSILNNLGSTVGIAFAHLGALTNGMTTYCSDCTITNPCAGGGTGAIAKQLHGVLVCN